MPELFIPFVFAGVIAVGCIDTGMRLVRGARSSVEPVLPPARAWGTVPLPGRTWLDAMLCLLGIAMVLVGMLAGLFAVGLLFTLPGLLALGIVATIATGVVLHRRATRTPQSA